MKSRIYIHLAIAFAIFPLYYFLGETFKYAMAPYIAFLVLSKNPAYLPALFVHFTPGTTISFFILILIFILTITNFSKLAKNNMRWIMLLALLPAPIFLYQTIERIFVFQLGLVDTLRPLAYYLGLFPFFYGVLLGRRITIQVLNSLLLVLLLLPMTSFVFEVQGSIRAYWLSFPLFFTILGSKFLIKDHYKISKFWFLPAFIFIGLSVVGLFGLKFTLIFSAFTSLAFLFWSTWGYHFILGFFTKMRVIIILFSLLVLIIAGSSRYGNVGADPNFNREELSYFEWDEFWLLFQYKAFDDRSVIWYGGWQTVKSGNIFWPPYEAPSYNFKTSSGSILQNINFGIHNIGLELMRQYGIIFGLIVTLTYLTMLVSGPGHYLRNNKEKNSYLVLLAGVCLGTGIVGGMVGQFVLMNSFSLMLMSLSGVLLWKANDRKNMNGK